MRTRAVGVGVLLITLLAVLPLRAEDAPLGPVVITREGKVQGRVADGIHTFKGLRYAAPPIGAAGRFLPPKNPLRWTEVKDASAYGAPCVQMATGASANPTTELSKQLATIFTTATEMKIANEDCLFLNVWTPGTEGNRPVMVWIHGGGFAYGSGSWPVYDGHNLAKRGDVVVVTVNHRLNVFGYLYLGELAGEDYEESGNAGMLDLVKSLEWVRENITQFGGNPNNVTIFGESGGGAKVSTLMAMGAASGLFHKAIVESGPGLRSVPKDAATTMAKAVLEELGVAPGDTAALAAAPTDKVLGAAFTAMEKVGPAVGAFQRLAPVVDGVALDRHPFDPEAPPLSAGIPLLIGWTKDEMTLFNASEPWFGKLTEEELAKSVAEIAGGAEQGAALLEALRDARPGYSPTYLRSSALTASRMFLGSVQLAERKAAQKSAPVWVYELVWETPVGGGVFKSPHTLEIPFVFSNVDKSAVLVGTGDAPKSLESQMSEAWIAFARDGNPNHSAIPQWPTYDAERRATMVFDTQSRVVDDPDAAIRKALTP